MESVHHYTMEAIIINEVCAHICVPHPFQGAEVLPIVTTIWLILHQVQFTKIHRNLMWPEARYAVGDGGGSVYALKAYYLGNRGR
eukprot:scaffold421151_cov53-Attheya_sp.AAC.1